MKLISILTGLLIALPAMGQKSDCGELPFGLEKRSAQGSKGKVGFPSPLAGAEHRFFLRKEATRSSTITGYSDTGAATSGTGTNRVQWIETWTRFASASTYGDKNATVQVQVNDTSNGTRTANYQGSWGYYADPPPAHESAVALYDQLASYFGASLMQYPNGSSQSTTSSGPTLTQYQQDVITTVQGGSPAAGTMVSDSQNWLKTLSDEYTTANLIQDAFGVATSAMPNEWELPINPLVASFSSMLSLSNDDTQADVTAVQVRVTVQATEAGQRYLLKWDEVFHPSGGSPGAPRPGQEGFTGTGQPMSVVVKLPVPERPGVLSFNNWKLVRAAADGGVAGAGSPGLGAAGCCGGGGAGSEVPAASFDIQLGSDAHGLGAGALRFATTAANADTILRSNLRWDGGGGAGIEAFERADGAARQILTPTVMADVVGLTQGMEVRIYPISAMGSLVSAEEGYAILPGSTPFRTFRIENPDGTSANDRVRITQDSGAGERVWEYKRLTSKAWRLTYPGSLSTSTRMEVEESVSGTQRTVTTRRIAVSGGTPTAIEENSTRYDQFPGTSTGTPTVELVIESSAGVGGLTKTTYDYYALGSGTNWFAPEASKTPIRQILRGDGSWERMTYYSASKRVALRLSGFGNQGPTDETNLVELAVYDYSTTNLSDTATIEPDAPRRVEQYRLGTAIGRTWYGYWADRTEEVRAVSNSAVPATPGNLKTVTYYETVSGIRRVSRVVHPDGLETRYTYPSNGSPEPEYVDHGVVSGGVVVNGTRTRTEIDAQGRKFRTIRQDLQPGGIVITTDVVHHTAYDVQGRPTTTVYLDGEQVSRTYACCGLETETDRDGVTTTYGYDDAGRRISTTRYGITHYDDLDAAGRVWRRRRVGTDSTEVILSTTTYDTAGRMLTQLNAGQGAATTVSWPTTGTPGIRTTTHPTGAISQEENDYSGRVSRILGRATRPVRYVYGVDAKGPFRREIRLTIADGVSDIPANYSDTPETVTEYEDFLGRVYRIEYPAASGPAPAIVRTYSANGRLESETDPDGVRRFVQYDARGDAFAEILDVNQDGTTDSRNAGAPDRVTETLQQWMPADANFPVRHRTTTRSLMGTTATWTTNRIDEAAADGTRTWSTVFGNGGVTNFSWTGRSLLSSGTRYLTNRTPEGAMTIETYVNGRQTTTQQRNASGTQIARVTRTYDPHGRPKTATDDRNGTSTWDYYAGSDLLWKLTTPPSGTGDAPQTTVYEYDVAGRAWKVTRPDGGIVNTTYTPRGEVATTYGARSYPVEHTYDSHGRMKTLKTWQNKTAGTGAAVTTWTYDIYRGWLTAKKYEGRTTSVEYEYTPGGRLKLRRWERNASTGGRLVTTYRHGIPADSALGLPADGGLHRIEYGATTVGTPEIRYTYDRAGRRTSTRQFNGATELRRVDWQPDETGAFGTETQVESGATTFTLTRGADSVLRPGSLTLQRTATNVMAMTYGYDTASRLTSVSDGTLSATYAYQANSDLLSTITLRNGATMRLTTTRVYDRWGRLQSQWAVANAASVQPTVGSGYTYNAAGQRIRQDLGDGTYWTYAYDSLGQLTGAQRRWPDGTLVAGQQYGYLYDDIGNRKQSQEGGDANGAGLQTTTYTANLLNQYSSITTPGVASVNGLANATNTVTVNGAATARQGEYWWRETSVANAAAPVWASLNVAASNGGTTNTTVNRYVPKANETPTYDDDGNQTGDGRWIYRWDAENRLVEMETTSTAITAGVPYVKVRWTYDPLGRRIQRESWQGASPVVVTRYVYDGWQCLAELDGSNAVTATYAWGLDLSGSRTGAGGVGGLLWVNHTQHGRHFYSYDGNGNVCGLASATDGTRTGGYEYDPFGGIIRANEAHPVAGWNEWRFSTKRFDGLTKKSLYESRLYTSESGRWFSRDMLGESASSNNLRAIDNDFLSNIDLYGFEKGSARGGATDLMRMTTPAYPGLDIGPIDGVKMLIGLPFGILSGDYFAKREQQAEIQSDRCAVTIVVNGIFNNADDRKAIREFVSAAPRFRDSQVISGVNPTSYIGDPFQILGDELRLLQVTPLRIANQINQAFLRLKGNGCCCLKIQVLAHSQGAKVLERAASVLPKDVRRVMYVTTIGGQTAISKKLGFAGVDNFSNRTGCINRDWVSVIGNYNPMRIPTAVLGMEAGWTRTHPHVENWMEHSYQPYYACLVHSLPLNGPCIPIK
jgi:RHS repeat-associated protein